MQMVLETMLKSEFAEIVLHIVLETMLETVCRIVWSKNVQDGPRPVLRVPGEYLESCHKFCGWFSSNVYSILQ